MDSLTSEKSASPLQKLRAAGQSVWLDYIRRDLLRNGELARMIERDGLVGMTSNPAIFEKAIAGSQDYASDLEAAGGECASNPKGVFERIAIQDIREACDLLQPVHAATKFRDGYVSLEVAPDLAFDMRGTVEEARRLWNAVERRNVMIKVPGTPAGIAAVRELLAEGINVNVTLLFSVDAYESVQSAWLDGLEIHLKRVGAIDRIASVASFFVSRIDSLLDPKLEQIAQRATSPNDKARATSLLGRIAIANAKVAYQSYLEMKKSPRWQHLAIKGAMPQRLLWASSSTKNPKYRDVLYVEELIGPETVATIPPQTYDAFRDHGVVKQTLAEDVDAAKRQLAELERTGLSLKAATDQLVGDGVRLFKEPFDKLLKAVASAGASAAPRSASGAARLTLHLPPALDKAVHDKLAEWQSSDKSRRLWASDKTLWTGADEASWTGWLKVVEQQRASAAKFRELHADVRAGGFTHFCLLGMGGSSLCPEVWSLTFGKQKDAPELVVLDSTDPQQLLATERRIDLTRTLFCVSSKSGSTLEPNIFKQHFFERVKQVVGAEEAGRRFVAVTDPLSQMEKVAQADRFRRIFAGVKSIGGRYSALSDFGLVPAAAMGIDVDRLLARAHEMAEACGPATKSSDNPGVVLGAVLGAGALLGRDKVTIATSPSIFDLGAWIEQLLAESTGKIGRGLIPVDRESLAAPDRYGNDRLFLSFEVVGDPNEANASALAALAAAGHPVVRIPLRDAFDLAAEFFRLEIATAVAGSLIGINPFDQPDVEASKVATRKLTTAYEQSGALPDEKPFLAAGGVRLFADERNAMEISKAAGAKPTLATALQAHFARIKPGDYAGFLAYVDMNATHESLLQEMRHRVRDRRKVATCLGFGPRFLHSTGQAYKGGPNSGVFLQVTCDDARDVPVPGQKYTFGVVKAAQARGDFAVLAERGRRALRVHVGGDVAAGLAKLRDAVKEALA